MKKLLFVILTLLAIAPANAQDKKHNLAVSFETSDYSYREPSIPYPPHWTGTMYGVSAKYTGRGVFSESQEEISSDRSFWSLELRYMQGDTDYDGFLQNGTPFKGSDIGDYYIEGAITAGAVYDICPTRFFLYSDILKMSIHQIYRNEVPQWTTNSLKIRRYIRRISPLHCRWYSA